MLKLIISSICANKHSQLASKRSGIIIQKIYQIQKSVYCFQKHSLELSISGYFFVISYYVLLDAVPSSVELRFLG